MASAKAKTINLLLYEGDLGGVISIEDSSWNSGELYSAPRDSVADLLSTDACNKFGVYLLLSKDMVYVGQSSDLAKRITQHTVGKDWWTSVVILTTKDDSLTRSDIDYLEYNLIEKAQKIDRLDCDNKKKGNAPKVDKFRKVVLQQYLEEALFLMQLIGITVFNEAKPTAKQVKSKVLFETMDINSKLALGKRVKKEAIEFVESQGVKVGSKSTYAVKQSSKDEFWANPKTELLHTDWFLILNNNVEMELSVLKVPAESLSVENEKVKGLAVRTDKTDLINLNINVNTLRDRISGIDFSQYLVKKIKY